MVNKILRVAPMSEIEGIGFFGYAPLRLILVFGWHLMLLILAYMFGVFGSFILFVSLAWFLYFYRGLSRFINLTFEMSAVRVLMWFSVVLYPIIFILLFDHSYYPDEIWFTEYIVELVLFTPLAGILALLLISEHRGNIIRIVSLCIFSFSFLTSLLLYVDFAWLPYLSASSDFALSRDLIKPFFMNIKYSLFVDALNVWFIILTTFLFFIVALVSWESVTKYRKLFFILLMLLEFFLLNIFMVEEILLFYVYFEASAIPMFLFIGIWGSTIRRVYASFKFLFYTLAGSILMFLMLAWFYYTFGSTNINILSEFSFPIFLQICFFIAFFSSFAVKIPMVPIHLWLPEAHVEAPTGISVLLAGILLKTGGYAFIKFVLPLCTEAVVFFSPLVYLLSIVSIVYGSFAAIVQTDLKKMIAYSSVAHMNVATIGIFSGSVAGLQGALYLMLTHGIVSSALFICVGILYDRYHTRIIRYYGGLVNFMPLFAIFFLILVLANISFPSTASFVAEFMLLSDIFNKNVLVAFLAGLGIILGAVYSVWLYNRIMFGYVNLNIRYFTDLNFREYIILFIMVFFTFLMGIYPTFFLGITFDTLFLINDFIVLHHL
jgi:NADH-quinone oxidoreductase subunit M